MNQTSLETPGEHNDAPGIEVSLFDCSVERHFMAIDMISKLCGEAEADNLEESEVQGFSSSITFLREWKHFNCQPRAIRFSSQTNIPPEMDAVNGIDLPQFSAVSISQERLGSPSTAHSESRKDFVFYVGGPVWALDWCPRDHQSSDCHIKCEFLAVSAHPSESSYHVIGAPLTGRGIIQIWCLLNGCVNKDEASPAKSNRLTKSKEVVKEKPIKPKKARGRPRKNAVTESLDCVDCNYEPFRALDVQFPEDSLLVPFTSANSENMHGQHASEEYGRKCEVHRQGESACYPSQVSLCKRRPKFKVGAETDDDVAFLPNNGRKRRVYSQGVSACDTSPQIPVQKKRLKAKAQAGSEAGCLPLFKVNENKESFVADLLTLNITASPQYPILSGDNVSNGNYLKSCSTYNPIPKNVALPRLVLCLAHNGKVAWDIKWRPSSAYTSKCKQRMGYLAVLLGDGSLEVWEVPSPRAVNLNYSSLQGEGTDPRFIKLEPVFKCSKLRSGDKESIPLTVDWSSFPNDLILAGCHDGTVALWKFSTCGSSEDTRPLLCFNADTAPIRAVSWAPLEIYQESANVMATAGHGGLKFWDINDPYRPLWTLNTAPGVIYTSLDWLPDPKCVLLTCDDGMLKILNLTKAAYDVPVTGKPFEGSKHQGLHALYCLPFTVWSVHASRLTGMVAYCSADGTVLHFQLTKSVERDPIRNRPPCFMCGSFTEEGSVFFVNTHLPNTPIPLKKVQRGLGCTPTSLRGCSTRRVQAEIKDRPTEDRILALCYHDDPGERFELEIDRTQEASISKQASKSRIGSEKKSKRDAVTFGDEERRPANVEGEAGSGREVLPPKIVAIHRVRWNMNKGSERLLCYGGAAGIVRCQEI